MPQEKDSAAFLSLDSKLVGGGSLSTFQLGKSFQVFKINQRKSL